ncbi:hypothetical protein BDW22DRAFT_1432258 [Trametopsis cervina]|nr:hypothetical protein BDW22DRAFT_1432258 [Trametopsis cervina]
MSVTSNTSPWKTIDVGNTARLSEEYLADFPLPTPSRPTSPRAATPSRLSPAPPLQELSPADKPVAPQLTPYDGPTLPPALTPLPVTPPPRKTKKTGKSRAKRINTDLPPAADLEQAIPPSQNFFAALETSFTDLSASDAPLQSHARTRERTRPVRTTSDAFWPALTSPQNAEISTAGGPDRTERKRLINATSANLAGLSNRSANPIMGASGRRTSGRHPALDHLPSIPWLTDADFYQVHGRPREGDDVTTEEADERMHDFDNGINDWTILTADQIRNREIRMAKNIEDLELRLGRIPIPSILPLELAYPKRAELARQIAIKERRVAWPQPDEDYRQSPMPLSFPEQSEVTNLPSPRNSHRSHPSDARSPSVVTYQITERDVIPTNPGQSASQPPLRPPRTPSLPPQPSSPSPLLSPFQLASSPLPASDPVEDIDMGEPVQRADIPSIPDEMAPNPPHTPIIKHTHRLPYAHPAAHWRRPRGPHPSWWFNNLALSQLAGWKSYQGPSVLIRLAFEGCPTKDTAALRTTQIESIITGALGPIEGLRVAFPAPYMIPGEQQNGNKDHTKRRPKPGQPPYSYLGFGITDEIRETLLNLKAISTTEGTVFFTPNESTVDSLLLSVEGVATRTTPDELIAHLQIVFDACSLDDAIDAATPTNPLFAEFTLEEARYIVRQSLQVTIHDARSADDKPIRIAHIFILPPTAVPKLWQDFKDAALLANFTSFFWGMDMAPFDGWLCACCHSALHPTDKCPVLTEAGWYPPPNRPKPTTPPALKQAEITPPDDGTSFTTIKPTSSTRGDGRRKNKGRGNRNGNGRGGDKARG